MTIPFCASAVRALSTRTPPSATVTTRPRGLTGDPTPRRQVLPIQEKATVHRKTIEHRGIISWSENPHKLSTGPLLAHPPGPARGPRGLCRRGHGADKLPGMQLPYRRLGQNCHFCPRMLQSLGLTYPESRLKGAEVCLDSVETES
jgi:hypothetical protein